MFAMLLNDFMSQMYECFLKIKIIYEKRRDENRKLEKIESEM